MSRLKHCWRSHAWRFSWIRIPRQLRIAVLTIVIAGAVGGIATGDPVGVTAVTVAAEVVKVLAEKKCADQSKNGRGERLYIQAWRSRRTLRRPSVDPHPLPAEGEGSKERNARLCAELGEIPAASRASRRPDTECWRRKMEPSAHLVSNLELHVPPPKKVNRLKRWRHSCARLAPRIPWQRMAVVLVQAVLTARRILEIVEFFTASFPSGMC